MIRFNKPYLSGKELSYMSKVIDNGKISGNHVYTKKCHEFFKNKYGFNKTLLTTSCTDALEMSAILASIEKGDEVILPSYTFVSTSNAFILRGAILKFVDSYEDNPNMNHNKIEEVISEKTKAIIVVHYAGVACNMDPIQKLAKKYNLFLIEDAAQAIDSYYKDTPLGTIGDFGAFSFHETKNIICGEGGLLAINNENYSQRAEIIWEKGTNRSSFFRGEVDKYGWVDIGSSFLPSDILAAFLFAQLENLEVIQNKRISIWNYYNDALKNLEESGKIMLPNIPDYATNNGHLFYIVCNTPKERASLISFLKENEIHAVFHYLSLHKSIYYAPLHDGRELTNCDKFSECLVRLPLFFELTKQNQNRIIEKIHEYFK